MWLALGGFASDGPESPSMPLELPTYVDRVIRGANKLKKRESGRGQLNGHFPACPKRYDSRPLISPSMTVSFRIDYEIFAGFWADASAVDTRARTSGKSDYPSARRNLPDPDFWLVSPNSR